MSSSSRSRDTFIPSLDVALGATSNTHTEEKAKGKKKEVRECLLCEEQIDDSHSQATTPTVDAQMIGTWESINRLGNQLVRKQKGSETKKAMRERLTHRRPSNFAFP
jgi:hypothetical protein